MSVEYICFCFYFFFFFIGKSVLKCYNNLKKFQKKKKRKHNKTLIQYDPQSILKILFRFLENLTSLFLVTYETLKKTPNKKKK